MGKIDGSAFEPGRKRCSSCKLYIVRKLRPPADIFFLGDSRQVALVEGRSLTERSRVGAMCFTCPSHGPGVWMSVLDAFQGHPSDHACAARDLQKVSSQGLELSTD